ncbi:phosphate ABC transporter ATP-binding protein PstB [Haloechinothrix sp. LS1_15]|uniref:phosphate ABC transporter ATP-binding protein PstB n=1 Tax=Haloechinothrix sp. LS1_15 TaxID=2652248 RepID=UPI0029469528|nr:phosphate ABC transporter ATP-binding protein PstB [Haloechinothrix sp. LS1_15]MDV6013002.1 phosphate ABC transporter ATP-binding protein [Haloechinothrix sp. LS1_15]
MTRTEHTASPPVHRQPDSASPIALTGSADSTGQPVLSCRELNVYYSGFHAVADVNLDISGHRVSALIGPSGCGKSTVLRCLNRMNDLVPAARVSGSVRYRGTDIYAGNIDATEVRRRIGMVFQKPNPFPKSIYDNVAYGPRVTGVRRSSMDDVVERALRGAALWDEVKDKLSASALTLSGGQQQRLCIARAIAVEPDVVLMDEPCSALDPVATTRIEDLIQSMVTHYTIVIVTHNMQQAARVSDMTAFFTTEVTPGGDRTGRLVECDTTRRIFSAPRDQRTEDYISGRFG